MNIREEIRKIEERQQIEKENAKQLLLTIADKDPMFFESLAYLLLHIESTYSDKYEEAQPYVDNTWLKYGDGMVPAGHNVGQAVNYLKRYLSQGHAKSYKTADLNKAIHFILFELTRRLHE